MYYLFESFAANKAKVEMLHSSMFDRNKTQYVTKKNTNQLTSMGVTNSLCMFSSNMTSPPCTHQV